jgi:hypothetical protein
MLNGGHRIATPAQPPDDLLPTRGVGDPAMHKDEGRPGSPQNPPPRTLFGWGDQEPNPFRLWIEHLSRGGRLQLLNTHHARNPSTGAPAAAANAVV